MKQSAAIINDRPKISVFIATSIDGYIAGKSGDMTWLENFSAPTSDTEEGDCGFSRFLSGIDVLVMGRKTYDLVATKDFWPYTGKRVVVLSSSLTSVCDQAELYNGDIIQLTNKLHAEGCKHLYVDGGATVSQFLNAKMVDEFIISIIPVVLGSGIPLFQQIHDTSWFQTVSSTPYSNGLIQLKYQSIQ